MDLLGGLEEDAVSGGRYNYLHTQAVEMGLSEEDLLAMQCRLFELGFHQASHAGLD